MLSLIVICVCAVRIFPNSEKPDDYPGFPEKADTVISARYEHAVALFNEHDDTGEALEEARQEFLSILSIDPHHAPSLSYLGFIKLDDNNTTSADSLFTLALASDSTCPEAHVGRAQMFRQRLQWQKGYDEAHLAVKLAPSSSLARWELVNELIHRAEAPVTDSVANEAIPHLKKLIELNTNDRDAHLNLAELYEHKMWLSDAAKQYREVLRIGQTSDDMDVWVYTVHLDAARCYEQIGEYEKAIEELKGYLEVIKEYNMDDEVRKIEDRIRNLESKTDDDTIK